MKVVDRGLFSAMLDEARKSPRRRSHHNLHESLGEPIHRLLICACPDTVIHPHRHPGKWECLTVLSGKVTGYVYDDNGGIVSSATLGGGDVFSVELPAGCWHNFVAEQESLLLEVKAGPYVPASPEDTAAFDGMLPGVSR